LRCDVEGGPFQWWKFNLPRVVGKIHWQGEQLLLEDVRAQFYEGVLAGNAAFDVGPARGTDFNFDATVTDANFHLLMADVAQPTNRLEGTLTGRLTVTRANSDDWRSWQGAGHVHLQDGLIWEIPIFGKLSPALDSIIPGLGNSRASEGRGSFVITNGVIHSDDLEIRASIMRLQYFGNIDLQGRVDARVDAELLRDTWFIGRIVSLALWPVSKIFEYQISGTLAQPKMDPVFFIPKVLLMPFHPIRTIKELLPEEPARTNAPAPPK
jgi:hypothetical protein